MTGRLSTQHHPRRAWPAIGARRRRRGLPTAASVEPGTDFGVALAERSDLSSCIDVPVGRRLTVEGEVAREAVLILDGSAQVLIGDRCVATVGPGDLVGELALLEGTPRSATVVASTPMRILVMDHGQFSRAFQDPQLAKSIATALSRRLRHTGTYTA